MSHNPIGSDTVHVPEEDPDVQVAQVEGTLKIQDTDLSELLEMEPQQGKVNMEDDFSQEQLKDPQVKRLRDYIQHRILPHDEQQTK